MARHRASFAALLLAGSPLAHAQAVLPAGGTVAMGRASIGTNGTSVTVDQTSTRAVVNWDSFSVGQGASIRFDQPGAGAAILNRVTGATASTIAGAVTGNGQVFLVNPNGIAITATGTVTVAGGFVASTLDIADRDFASGTFSFAGQSAGMVSNAGSIRVGSGGFAALLGGRVASSGTIVAPLGRIGLGSARQATLDLTGDGFLQVALPSTASSDDPLVEAAGRLSGARIELRAATVSDAMRNAVNVPGELVAQGAHAEGGAVVIEGGAGGAVQVSGRIAAGSDDGAGGSIAASGASLALAGAGLDVSGGTQGGAITLSGTTIDLAGHSALVATGAAQGGTVLVGGSLHGAGDLPQAISVTMGSDAMIDVSATRNGNGGTAVLWTRVEDPASLTRLGGAILARGAGTGDGGMVETSGHRVETSGGLVNAGALLGKGGTWLIDPADATITQSVANSYAASLNTGTSVTDTVTGSITWGSGVTLAKTAGGDATLTLQAGNPSGNSPITLTGANITSTSGALNLVLWTRYNSTTHEGLISITGSTIATNGGSVWMGGGLPGGTFNGLAVGLNPATTYTANKQAIYLATTSITTGAGSMYLRGQSNVGSSTTGTKNIGIWLDTGTSLSTTTGTIIVAGDVLGSYTNGAGVVLGGRAGSAAGNVTLSTTSGAITLTGTGTDSTGSGSGQRDALVLDAYAAGDQTMVKSVSGAIALTGTASFINASDTSSAGVRLENDTATGQLGVVTQSGAIAMTGSNTLDAAGALADGLILSAANAASSIRIGYDGINADTGAITLTADAINQLSTNAAPGSISMQTGGALKIQSSGNSFTYLRSGASGTLSFGNDWNFGTGLTGFTLGKSTNTAALALGNALSVAGPIAITGGSIALGAPLAATGGNAISLVALSGGITGTAAAAIANSGSLTLDVEAGGAAGTLVGAISGAGNLIKRGAGTVTLAGSNSYAGATTVDAGTLALGSTTGIGNASALAVASGATFDLQGFSVSTGSLSGAGTVTDSGADATLTTGTSNASASFSGVIQDGVGALSLTKAGSGTQVLSGENGFSGALALSGGVLQLGGAGTLGAGAYGGAIALGGGTVLELSSSASQTLSGAISGMGALTKDTGAATLTLSGANSYTGTTTVGSGTLDLTGSWNVGAGSVQIDAASGASVTGDGTVTAGMLLLGGAGSYGLTGANQIAMLAGTGTLGALALNNAASLTLGALSVGGTVRIATAGDLTLAPGAAVSSAAGGDALVLWSANRFLNNAGSGALSAASGRWLVHAASPATSLFSGLDSGNTAVWDVGSLGTVSQSGNRYLFTQAPVLTVTAADRAKTYGQSVSFGAVAGTDYTVGGLSSGVAGAFLGDTMATALSGAPVLASGGAAAEAAVGGGAYAITVSQGTLGALAGYHLIFADGTLTVSKAGLTVTALDAAKTYDGLAYGGGNGVAYAGFVNGENAAVLSGALAYGGTAQGAVNAGNYSLTASGLTSGNYAITYAPGVLNIGKAGLTVIALDAAKTYDGLAYGGGNGVAYAGFVNGENVSVLNGALAYGGTAQGAVNAGNYSLTASGLSSGNYDVHYVAGLLRIDQRPITVTADSLFRTAGGPNPMLTYSISGEGLVADDSLDGALATKAVTSSPPGMYQIGQGTLMAGANYAMTFVPGSLVVGPVLFVAAQLPSVHVAPPVMLPIATVLDFRNDTICTSASADGSRQDAGQRSGQASANESISCHP